MVELKGISQSELEQVKKEYPFLEEIIEKACNVPLFKIHVKPIDEQLMGVKSHEFSHDSGYEYDWAYFAVCGNEVSELGFRYQADYSEPIHPAPTVREAIDILSIKPDFIVGAYYVTKKHNGDSWKDVELTIHEPIKYYCDTYQGFKEPVDEMWSSPLETIFVIVEGKNEAEARELVRGYKPSFKQNLGVYSCTSNSQYPLKGLTESGLKELMKQGENDSSTTIVRFDPK